MTIRPNWTGFNHFQQPRTTNTFRYVVTPTCTACHGSTLGKFGEQCRTCNGAGFLTYKGGQGVGRSLEKR